MTRGRNTHSGLCIASTFVISREKNSYANFGVVYTRVITLHYPVFPKLLLDGRMRVDTFPASLPRRRV